MPCFPLPPAACSLLSYLPLSPCLEPLSYPSRTLIAVPALAAFFAPCTPALYRSCLPASLTRTLLSSLLLTVAPRRCFAALPSLPFPSVQSTAGFAAVPPFLSPPACTGGPTIPRLTPSPAGRWYRNQAFGGWR